MNELDKLISEYEPLSSPLSEDEILSLKKQILAKGRPKRKPYKLILALAAAMCLLAACGAMAVGFFDSMTDVNQTARLVEKYGQILENPPSVTVDGHTVTLQAIIRSDSVARIIYDVTGTKRQTNAWSTFKDTVNDRQILRIQPLTNGQPSGRTEALPGYDPEVGYCQLRQSAPMGKVSETGSIRYFADLDLTEGADAVSLYVLSEDGFAEVIQADLPEAAAEKQYTLPHITYEIGSDTKKAEYIFEQLTITPFRLMLTGTHQDASMSFWENEPDWYSFIHLYDADGKEIKIGQDGSFYSAAGYLGPEDFSVELGSYDLIDPKDICEIEINGERLALK